MVHKLFSNLGLSAVHVIGWRMTLRMWWGFVLKFPAIIRHRNLFPLDQYMSSVKEISINGHYGTFKVRPSAIDKMIKEECTTFSSIRELYIRDCYFRFHNFSPDEIKTVLDLGANRGLASAMFTPFAMKIVSIEAQPEFQDVIHFNVSETNGFKDHQIGCFFLDRQHSHGDSNKNIITIDEVLRMYGLDQIDFLKIDIEGSEFKIFDQLPFSKIKYLSMEVHRELGSPASLVDILKENLFSVVMATSRLNKTNDPNEADYIYACNERLRAHYHLT